MSMTRQEKIDTAIGATFCLVVLPLAVTGAVSFTRSLFTTQAARVAPAPAAVVVVAPPVETGAHDIKVAAANVKPEGADYWSEQYQEWRCGIGMPNLSGRYARSYACPEGGTPEQKLEVNAVWSCVGRSGKTPQTMGYSWALAQCEADSNFVFN
jgi:hypothetical protein